MLQIYGIKNCGSVKKALQFFNDHQIDYQFHDFKTDPVSLETIKKWVSKSSSDVLLNKKGTTYRTLALSTIALDEEAKLHWMAQHNLLIKRPVIEYQENLIVGYDESYYKGIFES